MFSIEYTASAVIVAFFLYFMYEFSTHKIILFSKSQPRPQFDAKTYCQFDGDV